MKGKMSVKLDIAAGKEIFFTDICIYLIRIHSIQIIGHFGSVGT